jgi:hypothetical protein
MARSVLLIVTSLPSLRATSAMAGALPEQAEAVLKTGKPWVRVSQSGAAAVILAAIEIDAPPPMVWAAMLDCARVRKMIANLTICRVVNSGPGWDVPEDRRQAAGRAPAQPLSVRLQALQPERVPHVRRRPEDHAGRMAARF